MQRHRIPAFVLVIAVLAPACQDSEGAVSEDNQGDTTGSGAPVTGDPTANDEGNESADESTGSGGGITGTATDGGETGTGQPTDVDPCETLDCGDGDCKRDRDGRPTCVCPEGQVAAGLECLVCAAIDDEYDVDVTAVDVEVSITIDGLPPPASASERASLGLRNPATGDLVELGDTHDATLSTRVLPTIYELVYRRELGATIPANRSAVLGYIDARGGGPLVFAFALETVRLTGTFAFDGVDAPDSGTENGRVWLRNAASGDAVSLGETRSQSFDVLVLPGTYVVEYESLAGAEVAPRNHRARVGELEVPAGVGESDQRIDIATQVVSGAFLVDGAPAPGSAAEWAAISLLDGVTGDEILLGNTDAGEYSARVVAGDYDVLYAWKAGSAVMPANRRAVVGQLATHDPATHTIDIPTVTIAGSFTIDGAPPPDDNSDDGRLSLRGDVGDDVPLGNTTAGGFERIVIARAYSIRYAQDTSSGVAPANADALLGTIDVANEPSFDIDIPTAFVSGSITIGLGAPPDSDYDDGWVYLRNADSGDTVLLANTRVGIYGAAIVPGQYEVVYAVETPGGQVPINIDSVVVDVVDLDGVGTLDIDIPVQALVGSIGAPSSPGERGSIYLQASGDDDRSLLGTTVEGLYGQPVIPGRYLVSYGADTATGGLPVNTDAPIACIDLAKAD